MATSHTKMFATTQYSNVGSQVWKFKSQFDGWIKEEC